MSRDDCPQELKDLEELEKHGTVRGKKPVEHIREMNPGVYIPTGEELAAKMRAKDNLPPEEDA